MDKTDDEEDGITWDYASDRGSLAFIRETGIPSIIIKQTNSTTSGSVTCLVPADCAGLEIKMIRAGIADIPDRFERITYTDENGRFDFSGVPQGMTLNIYVEKKHFCWVRQMLTVSLDRLKTQQKVEFVQRGFEFTYKSP